MLENVPSLLRETKCKSSRKTQGICEKSLGQQRLYAFDDAALSSVCDFYYWNPGSLNSLGLFSIPYATSFYPGQFLTLNGSFRWVVNRVNQSKNNYQSSVCHFKPSTESNEMQVAFESQYLKRQCHAKPCQWQWSILEGHSVWASSKHFVRGWRI